MRITNILPVDRIFVDGPNRAIDSKEHALRTLSELLSPALACDTATIESLFAERERLQSTGIGDGVAIPHTSLESAATRAAAMVLTSRGVGFDSIDGAPVHIVLGVVGPKDSTGEHLRVLARISRLLRDEGTRRALSDAPDPAAAFAIIEQREQQLG